MAIYDIGEDIVQEASEVKIPLSGVTQYLDLHQGVRTMKGIHLKSEIAQRELSDFQCIPSSV